MNWNGNFNIKRDIVPMSIDREKIRKILFVAFLN